MQLRSGGLPSSSLFSDLKGLLELVSDPKKAKQALEDISADREELQKLYSKFQSEKVSHEEKCEHLHSAEEDLQKQRVALDEKQKQLSQREKALEEKEKNLSSREKELGLRFQNLEDQHEVQLKELKEKEQEAEKRSARALENNKEAVALKKEYEEKLDKLKDLVKG